MKTLNKYQKRWLEALRSGEFKQGERSLKANGEYCCLGVACEVLKDELRLVVHEEIGVTTFNDSDLILPPEVTQALELDSEGRFKERVEYKGYREPSLTVLNDSRGASFLELADIIEQAFLNNNFKQEVYDGYGKSNQAA